MYSRITCVVLLFFQLFCWSGRAHAQTERISYSCQSCQLTTVLNELSEQANVIFAYQSELVEEKMVSIEISNMEMEEILEELLGPLGLRADKLGRGRFAIQRARTVSIQRQAETRTISGVVRHLETGEPLPYASVRIGTNRGARTTENGVFFIALSEPFPDSLTVTYLGFEQIRLPIQYGEDQEIMLTPVTTSIEDIIITDANRESLEIEDGGATVKIDPKQLHLFSGLGEADLIRGLQLLPGLTAANERASGLYIRGGTPAENLILFDGITVYQPGHFFGLLSAFNADAIRDVKLYRSGMGARYGGRTGGVIDITGKPGRVITPQLSASVNLMNAQVVAQVPWEEDKGGLLISARRSFTDVAPNIFFQRLFDSRFQEGVIYFGQQSQNQSEDITVNPRLHYFDFNAKWLYRPNDRDLFSATAFKSGDDLLYELSEVNDNGPDVMSDDILRLVNEGAATTYARQWNKSHYTRLNLAWSSFRNRYQYTYQLSDDPFFYRSDLLRSQWLQDFAFRLEHTWTAPNALRVTGGIHRNMLALRDIQSLDDTQNALSQEVTNTDQGLSAAFIESAKDGSIGGWEVGLRSHLLDGSSNIYLEPRIMGYLRIRDRLRIQGNVGRYHQFLNYVSVYNGLEAGEDFWALADGDSVAVLQTDVASLSLSYDHKDFLVQVEGYAKRQAGLMAYELQYNPNLNETDPRIRLSDGNGRAAGVELLLQKKTGIYTGWISYTYSRVFQQFPDNIESVYAPSSFDRPHQFNSVNQVQLGRFELAGTFILASGIPVTPAEEVTSVELPNGQFLYFLEFGPRNSVRLPMYHRLDLTATYTLSLNNSTGRFGISLFNVYGRRNIGNRVYAVIEPQNNEEVATIQILDKPLLGFTPNLFLRWEF